jgi:hypothetical protein
MKSDIINPYSSLKKMVDINGKIKSHIPLSGGQSRAMEEKNRKLEVM